MRRFDKKKNMSKANLLAEQRHLDTKEVIKESFHKADGTPIPVDKNHMPIKKENMEPNEDTFENIPQMEEILNKYGLLEILKSAMGFYKKGNEKISYKITKTIYDYTFKNLQ